MNKYPIFVTRLCYSSRSTVSIFGRILSLVGLLLASTSVSPARIGESRDSLERRLFSSGAIIYRDAAIQQSRQKGMPYLDYLSYLPGSTEVRVYFKTADGRRPTSNELDEAAPGNGWDLHVVYVNGKSAIEVYQRTGGMSEQELNHLLKIHAGGSFWKRLGKEEQVEIRSAFGFDMVREDGEVRAKQMGRGGSGILFVDAAVDTNLAVMNERELEEKAPVSVGGF